MDFLRSHIVSRCLRLILALHILNCSVDTFDLHSNAVSENLSHNDMESIVEIMLEGVLQIDNAFAEHDEQDGEGDGLVMKMGVDLSCHDNSGQLPFFNALPAKCRLNGNSDSFASQFHPELISPPPKA